MAKYILKKLFYSLVALYVLITIVFILMQFLPGDPFSKQKAMPENIKKQLIAKYGLDKPKIEQYFHMLYNYGRFDFGVSMKFEGRTVNGIIAEHFPKSLELGIRALIFALIGGIILGTIAGVYRGTKWDTMIVIIAVIGVSVPSFILGSILQYFLGEILSLALKDWFGLEFNLIPVTGWDSWQHKLLPAFALGMGGLASITRLLRSSMIDVIGQDYIRTAKAKGLSNKVIVFKHALRNAIIPVITLIGPMAASIIMGSFVIEKIFAISGLGNFFVDSIMNNDYSVILGLATFDGALLLFAQFLVEIAYGIVDPRIRLE